METFQRIRAVEKILGLKYNNNSLLWQALTHTSYAHEHFLEKSFHNERLEFLGDAVLELIISQHLYETFPALPEGKLTKLRANIVCETSLVKVARQINLGEFLFLGKGELSMGGRDRPSILADALEAIIGSLYIDQGYEEAKKIALNLLKPVIEEIQRGIFPEDYKTLVQEYLQKHNFTPPRYRIVQERGPDHNKQFVAQVIIKDEVWGEGEGKSKKEAEQSAACRAWDRLRNNYLS